MAESDAHALAIRIAERVAPDEVDIAPDVLDAAIRGGREWEELLRQRRTPLVGGIGPDTTAGLLLIVFDWLRQNGPTLLGCISSGLNIILLLRQVAGGGAKSPEATTARPPDTQAAIASLEVSILALQKRLTTQGQSQQQAAAITQGLLEELEAALTTTREVVERLERRTPP
jgi:hypothetical protein